MRNLVDQIGAFFWNVFNRPQLKDWLDIIIVAFLIYQLFLLTRETRASQVLKGFGVLIIVSWLSSFLAWSRSTGCCSTSSTTALWCF